MGRFTRHGMDNQPLEGGGGGGSSIASKIGHTAAATGAAGMVGGQLYHIDKANKLTKERREAEKEKREAAAEMKREARGVEKSGTDRAREAAKVIADDEKYTKETPEQKYAKGGKVSASSRADGIATKGKTKGRFV
jgi:hypothetical protein